MPELSESARRARAAIMQQKRQQAAAQQRAENPPKPEERGPQHTCTTCHPEETERLLPVLARKKPPAPPNGAFICCWCGERTNNPRFGFHTYLKGGECVYAPLCPWCARTFYGSDRGYSPQKPMVCNWPDGQRKTLKTLKDAGEPVYRVRNILVVVPVKHDCYKKGTPCTTSTAESATPKPLPTPKSSSSSSKASTASAPKRRK